MKIYDFFNKNECVNTITILKEICHFKIEY